MRKLKVVTVVGTRPELIRLSRTIYQLDQNCDHILIHTGQNYDYELNQIFFDELAIRKPDFFLNAASGSVVQTISNIMVSVDELYERIQPECLLILGDTNSGLAAIPAKRRKIPIFHLEAGNRCFDYRVPEEINRKIIDHISDINLTYSEIARGYLLSEGLPKDQVIKIGSPMKEVLDFYKDKILASDILNKLNLVPQNFFLVSAHREENVDDPNKINKLLKILSELAERYSKPVIFSTHPRTQNKILQVNKFNDPMIRFSKPFGFFDYVNLQKNAFCVLSDSGTITEEASILGFDALNIREQHERPEGFEEATVMFTGFNCERIIQCIELLKNNKNIFDQKSHFIVRDYDVDNFSIKILKIILSYTDFINAKVWKKKGL